jgi:pyruvate formate lyase activating enzyme
MVLMATLESRLVSRTGPAAEALTEDLGDGKLRCLACGHRCPVKVGRRGVCRVRFNENGALLVPRGYVAGLAVDPIEKKPFYHVLPGSDALSFGMLGCDLHWSYCQNWLTSQALRDEDAGSAIQDVTAEEIVGLAVARGAPVVTSTYNEPLITAEWAAEVFDLAKAEGLLTSFVSNGHATPEVLDFLEPRLDLMKVDLKTFDSARYRKLGGQLSKVLASIEGIHARGMWCEIVTLVVPDFNDSTEELEQIARFIAGVSPSIPWHVTAFHPDYKMRDRGWTPGETLVKAYDIGREEGLEFVYPGNAAGQVGERENTSCPSCGALLVERLGYRVGPVRVTADGRCPDCGAEVAGRWSR